MINLYDIQLQHLHILFETICTNRIRIFNFKRCYHARYEKREANVCCLDFPRIYEKETHKMDADIYFFPCFQFKYYERIRIQTEPELNAVSTFYVTTSFAHRIFHTSNIHRLCTMKICKRINCISARRIKHIVLLRFQCFQEFQILMLKVTIVEISNFLHAQVCFLYSTCF